MKRYILPVLSLFLIASNPCCTKNTAAKDYSQSIKNRTWWGTITYAGQSSEYYSVHFNADNSLLWSQASGDSIATWELTGNQLTITFNGSEGQMKANISDNDSLLNIADNSDLYSVNSGHLITSPIAFLDNSTWKGSIIDPGYDPISLQITFKPNEQLVSTLGSGDPFDYTRTSSGAVFRTHLDATYYIFGVIISSTEMRGTEDGPDYHWQMVKQ